MKVIIPSLNRAPQLDFLLRSIDTYWNIDDLNINVIYKYSNDDFAAGYGKLIAKYWNRSNITFSLEHCFGFDVNHSIYGSDDEVIGFFTDDCVVYRQVDISAGDIARVLREDKSLLSFSLRLGENTIVQDYLTGMLQPALQAGETGGVLTWNWRRYPTGCNYSYFFSWDSHFYRKDDLIKWVDGRRYENPRALEHQLTTDILLRHSLRPKMAAMPQSSVFVNTINAVQGDMAVPAGVFHNYSAEYLNEKFLDGYVIDLESLYNLQIYSCHYEVPLNFVKA